MRFLRPLEVGALVVLASATAYAQSQAVGTADRPPLGSVITLDALAHLPSSSSLYSLIDASIPEVVGDRIDTGGLTTGDSGRLGARGNTWTQATFTLNGVDITAPGGSGTPLFVPGVDAWERVDVATGMLPVEVNSPGLAVLLRPRPPSAQWTGTLNFMGSPVGLNVHNSDANPPTISRLDTFADVDVSAGGPITPGRLGLFLTGTGTRSSRFDRGATVSASSSLASIFGHLVFTPTSADNVGIIFGVQRASYPFESRIAWDQPDASTDDKAGHVQVRWDRVTSNGTTWGLFGSLSGRNRTQDLAATSAITVERLNDGPVPLVAQGGVTGPGGERVWSFGGQLRPSDVESGGRHHTLLLGVEAGGASERRNPMSAIRVGELVNGLPARLWDFTASTESSWHSTSVALYAGDNVDLTPHVHVDLGLRFEAINGSAEMGTTSVSWRDWLPRAGVHWDMFEKWRISSLVSYGRYGYRLPLGDLAWGDASAPVANIFRWTGTPLADGGVGPVVQRYGPGTGGDPNFSSIDPNLKRPHMDDLTLGLESRPRPSTLLRLVGIARLERNMLGVVNTGAPISSYSTILVNDPGVDILQPSDDTQIPVYNRLPSTFGADRYQLTNPADDQTTFVGVEASGQVRRDHLFFLMAFTAGRSEGIAASRGFLATENDAGILGEVFTDPNARTNAQGRLFTERGYTSKIAMVYDFPKDITFGVEARYMDGQHFARLVVVPDLNQGAEAVRAFQNGKTRFTYVGTLDVRLQKEFKAGTTRVAGVIEAYNLANLANEVEEFTVTGSNPRMTSAVQPPLSVHIGLRVAF
jgi:hypothetical protein